MKVEDFYEKKKQEATKSFAFLIEKCEHSQNNPYGIKLCEDVLLDKPVVVLLPGTVSERENLKACNGLLKKIDSFVFEQCHFARGQVRVCAAVCHLGSFCNPNLCRELDYNFYNDPQTYHEMRASFSQQKFLAHAHPDYVNDIYRLVLKNCLYENGTLLPFKVAIRRLRKVIFVAYCHGAFTAMCLHDLMKVDTWGDMYTESQRKKMLKSIAVLAYSPDCQLGKSCFNFISLASASDLNTKHGLGFVEYVHQNFLVMDFGLCYLPEKCGNIFYCAKYSKNGVEGNPLNLRAVSGEDFFSNLAKREENAEKDVITEHMFLGFTPYKNMSKAALKLQKIGNIILKNAIKNALKKSPRLLSIWQLSIDSWADLRIFMHALSMGKTGWQLKTRWEQVPNRPSFARDIKVIRLDD